MFAFSAIPACMPTLHRYFGRDCIFNIKIIHCNYMKNKIYLVILAQPSETNNVLHYCVWYGTDKGLTPAGHNLKIQWTLQTMHVDFTGRPRHYHFTAHPTLYCTCIFGAGCVYHVHWYFCWCMCIFVLLGNMCVLCVLVQSVKTNVLFWGQ